MARSIRNNALEARTNRFRLPVAKKPVWVRIGDGLGLGYRRNQTAGTWVARIANGKGGHITKALGAADDHEDANGRDILTYWQAAEAARKLRRGEDNKPEAAIVTVSDALAAYADDLATRGGDKANVGRIVKHLPKAIADRPVALITADELRRWRDGVAKKIAAASVNRTCRGLKAALNRAADHDRALDRHAWTVGLALIPNAESAENVILPPAAIAEIVAAAHRQSVEFGNLVELAAMTGARFSQLARVQVQDMLGDSQTSRLNIPTSNKGRGIKDVRGRPVPITAGMAARLRIAAANRPATAPLLLRPDGAPWRHSDETPRFAKIAAEVGQQGVTMYALRHTSIVRQILAGVPLRLVAVAHDTSVVMIERNYSRYIDGLGADAALRAALPDFEPVKGDVVVRLSRSGA
jgi:integrase